VKLEIAGFGHAGKVRTTNDDWYAVGRTTAQGELLTLTVDTSTEEFARRGLLVAIADGMGGYAGGSIAADAVLNALTAAFYDAEEDDTSCLPVNRIAHSIKVAREAVASRLRLDERLDEAGTTLAGVALFAPNAAVVFHIGDSRVMRLSGGYLRQLTVDHSLIGMESAIEPRINSDERGAQWMNRLTRSVGLVGNGEPQVDSDFTWGPGDYFVLCTDGLHGHDRGLDACEIKSVLMDEGPIDDLAVRLVARAIEVDGQDNTSLVILRITEDTSDE
jgi:serine/threonine protein phosphatase PrpC